MNTLRCLIQWTHSWIMVLLTDPRLRNRYRKQYLDLVKKQEKLEESSSKSPYNYLEGLNPEYDDEFGVIACGIGYNYVKEADTDG